MFRKAGFALAGFAAFPYGLILALGSDSEAPSYANDVAPVIRSRCASCHSGDDPAAGIDLTTPAGLKLVIKPKDSRNSILIQRLRGIITPQMPKGFAPLPDDTIARIAAWIDSGAVFDSDKTAHWAYLPPRRPDMPVIRRSRWGRNPIDSLVYARLEKEGLKPSPEAPREVLLRRVYLDLIGLPPTPTEIDAFLADKRPDAYEQVVDRLMRNPHYGERQAEPWLDYSRYADSDGYEKDLNRTAWKYRDWLIDAFNRNLPYDRFTIEQLAGDLLPQPTQEQLVATGFNRNSMFNREGGVDQEEAHFNVVLDRVNTTATVWLGSTLGCARCHDHKYDPFKQRDYYRMAAFFADSQIYPRGPKEVGEEKWFESEIQVPSPEQEATRRRLKARLGELIRRLTAWTPKLNGDYGRWLATAKGGPAWAPLVPRSMASLQGSRLAAGADGTVIAGGPSPQTEEYVIVGPSPIPSITGLRIEALADPSLPAGGPGRAYNGNFVLTAVSLSASGPTANAGRADINPIKPAKAVADFDQRDFEARKVLLENPETGWAVQGGIGKSHEIVLQLAKPLVLPEHAFLQIRLKHLWPGGQHTIGKFRLSVTGDGSPASQVLPPRIRLLASKGRTPAEEDELRSYFLTVDPALDADRDKAARVQQDLQTLEREIPTALIMRDKPHNGPLTAYVHSRGEFLSNTDLVAAGFPEALESKAKAHATEVHQLRTALKADRDPAPTPHINANGAISGPVLTRLDLAKWLVSKENPLTARVEVNRLWEQFFGRGIVETSEDFGTQGSPPSNAQLLDWLACEFMEKGWDMKHLVRLIVTSSTYRQSSNATPELMRKDPQDLLLARGPRFRLDAETIRDVALSASGLLNPKIGGQSVYPFQPEGVWDNPFSSERWAKSKGGDEYRRGLYTFLKRTAPFPSFLNFDGTSRESCIVRRIRTNTPLQALATLNDEGLLDAARALGRLMMTEGGKSDRTKLSYGFRRCTGRVPTLTEIDRLLKLKVKLAARYSTDVEAAKKLAGNRDRATWTMVGNVLLNLDETMTKD